ncbi:PFL_4669 family integrating conjugative element protein [Pseudomonas sp. NPDC088368]|uniref:PFL_4669 family integrating conjugative element protein n=1 Tax=Pseudomonas sp. NPDC088368 TaxID=3364453 RepID=UPI003808ADDB
MADNFQVNLGSLRSSVNLTLHTHHASRLWFGRQRTDDKPGMIGMSGFSNLLGRITRGAAQDDPYSDWFMIMIEEKLAQSKEEMAAIDQRLDQVMAALPKMLSVGENLSVQPAKFDLFLTSPLAFQGIYLLTAYDELVRRVLLAGHVGMIDNHSKGQWLDEGAAILRRLYGLAQKYKGFSGASRDDFAANNARAQNAREMYAFAGDLPQDILEGTRRAAFAPQINRPSSLTSLLGADDDYESSDAHDDEDEPWQSGAADQ